MDGTLVLMACSIVTIWAYEVCKSSHCFLLTCYTTSQFCQIRRLCMNVIFSEQSALT